MNDEYEKLAEAASENAEELLTEARMLMELGRYARASSIAVLAAEEFAKAFLCKCYSVGIIEAGEATFLDDLRQHNIKLVHFMKIIIAHSIFSQYRNDFDEAVRVQQLIPKSEVLRRLLNRLGEKEKKNIQNAVDIFAQADQIKQLGFYADINGKQVLKPSEKMTKRRAEVLLSYVSVAHGLGSLLVLDDAQFRARVEILDYEVTRDSIKPSVMPRRKERQ